MKLKILTDEEIGKIVRRCTTDKDWRMVDRLLKAQKKQTVRDIRLWAYGECDCGRNLIVARKDCKGCWQALQP